MGWADNFLNRFRRAGAPGAAAQPGCRWTGRPRRPPSSRRSSRCSSRPSPPAEIRQRAEQDAEELREQARAAAAALVAEAARGRRPSGRTPPRPRADSLAKSAQLTTEAGRRAAARRRLAEERLALCGPGRGSGADRGEEQAEPGAGR